MATVASCDPATDPAARRFAVVNGTVTTGEPAAAAWLFRRAICDEAPRVECSGVLIGPRTVLTAAHCVDALLTPGGSEVYFGPSVGDPTGTFAVVSSFQVHPQYVSGQSDYDAALLVLAEPSEITPVALPVSTLDGASGRVARIVGFGTTLDDTIPFGTKVEGTMLVGDIAATTFRATPQPGLGCTHDSGAPVFVDLVDGEQLLGIHVAGDAGCDEYAVNVRVDALLDDFIRPGLAAAETAPPGWSPSALSPDLLCEQSCETSEDCPAAMECQPSFDGPGECVLIGLGSGAFGDGCSASAECSDDAVCARLWPDDCRCFVPCHEVGCLDCDDGGCGCATPDRGSRTVRNSPLRSWGWIAAIVSALLVLRRRRSRPRRSCPP